MVTIPSDGALDLAVGRRVLPVLCLHGPGQGLRTKTCVCLRQESMKGEEGARGGAGGRRYDTLTHLHAELGEFAFLCEGVNGTAA